MTDPLRWHEDPTLSPELKEWLTELPPPPALPTASLVALEAALAEAAGVSVPAAGASAPAGSVGVQSGATPQATGLLMGKLGLVGVTGAGALALAVLGASVAGGKAPAAQAPSEPKPAMAVPTRGFETDREPMESVPPVFTKADSAQEKASPSPELDGHEDPFVPSPSKPKNAPGKLAIGAHASSATGREAGGLAAEAALLAQAQASLTKAPARTVELLKEYERRFPERRLGLEADVLRIEALHAAGYGARARKAARAHLEAHPHGPYGRRIQELAGSNSLKDAKPSGKH